MRRVQEQEHIQERRERHTYIFVVEDVKTEADSKIIGKDGGQELIS
jgi:hypothetical protein